MCLVSCHGMVWIQPICKLGHWGKTSNVACFLNMSIEEAFFDLSEWTLNTTDHPV
jgi:hypothetical protein